MSEEDLKRRVLNNNHYNSSAGNSGTATPIQSTRVSSLGVSSPGLSSVDIEKTDSVINLTKPALYGIYNDNSLTALNKDGEEDDDEDGLYISKTNVDGIVDGVMIGGGGANVGSNVDREKELYNPHADENNRYYRTDDMPIFEGPIVIIILKFMIKIIILGICAYIYNEFTSQLRNDHIKLDKITFQPLYVTEILLTNSLKNLKPLISLGINNSIINYFSVVLIQGMIMGLFHPIMDFVMPPEINKRLLSSNPNPNKLNIFNDLIRLLITFMGISYAIRHIEFSSQLQVAVVWSLLLPALWIILDGTIGGLLASVCASIYGCLFIYITNINIFDKYSTILAPHEFLPIWMWTGSFFFCGLIIFGTLGRTLF